MTKTNQQKKAAMALGQKLSLLQTKTKSNRNRPPSRPQGATRRRNKSNSSMYMSSNPYVQSLANPEIHPGAKVPDLCTFPTGTFQLTYDAVVGPNSTGDSVGFTLNPRIQSPMTTFASTTPGGVFVTTAVQWVSQAAIQAAYVNFRPVSAEIYLEYIGNTFSDQGYVAAALLPRGVPLPSTSIGFLALPYVRTYPLREGVRVVWKPQDNYDMEFNLCTSGTVQFPSIAFCCIGMAPASTQSIIGKVRIVANYEGIPSSDNSTLVNAAPSPVDLGLLQQAMNWGSQIYNFAAPFVSSTPNFGARTANLVEASVRGFGMYRALQRIGPGSSMTVGQARIAQ